MGNQKITLNGRDLSAQAVQAIAAGTAVSLSADGLKVMNAARAVIEAATDAGTPIYGVTTGLGPKVVDTMPNDAVDTFSVATIRGRAHAVGRPLPATRVRAGMAVRANTLLCGAAGARVELAEHIVSCLNKQLTPAIPESGSIGVADLGWGGALGAALIGEGQMLDTNGAPIDAAIAMQRAGVTAFAPQLREGLALVSHSSITAGMTALGYHELQTAYHAAQTAAALTMEGFRANVSPLDARVLALRPQAGQQTAANQLLLLLSGSGLLNRQSARRLQDPLSIRNIVQVHGAVQATLDTLEPAVTDEINGASDNPAVLHHDGEILSHGGYLPVYLNIALTSALNAMVHLAALQVSRISKMLFARFTDLTNGLTDAGTDGAGLTPVMKTAEALYAEIAHLATPAPIYPGISADALEDVVTHTAIPVKATFSITQRLRQLSAIELLVAAQAIDARDIRPAATLDNFYHIIRTVSAHVAHDRPMGRDIDTLANHIDHGLFDACNN
jgi:histidine ammonia-lyase